MAGTSRTRPLRRLRSEPGPPMRRLFQPYRPEPPFRDVLTRRDTTYAAQRLCGGPATWRITVSWALSVLPRVPQSCRLTPNKRASGRAASVAESAAPSPPPNRPGGLLREHEQLLVSASHAMQKPVDAPAAALDILGRAARSQHHRAFARPIECQTLAAAGPLTASTGPS